MISTSTAAPPLQLYFDEKWKLSKKEDERQRFRRTSRTSTPKIETVKKLRNIWVENADRLVAGFLEMFEASCHKMGTVIRDQIQERLLAKANTRGLIYDEEEGDCDEDDDGEYYYDDTTEEEYYDDEHELE